MLFTPNSIIKARRDLLQQLKAGAMTREETFQRALALDEFDATALSVLSAERQDAGDLAAAAEYSWRAASADPCRSEPWFRLHACLPDESDAFHNAVLELAANKTLRSPDNLAVFKEASQKTLEAEGLPESAEALQNLALELNRKRREEPEEVSERLRPYRLIDEVLDAEAGLDEDMVDEVVEEGVRTAPLLIGVLRAMATGSLERDDPAPAVASLALLGEIGDPAVLPEIIECISVDHEDIRTAAHWAMLRIARRRPRESYEALRKAAQGADANLRSVIAAALALMPAQPEKPEFLASLLDGLVRFEKAERHRLFMSVAQAALAFEGAKGRELAWSLFRRHETSLPKSTRTELRAVEQTVRELDEIGGDVDVDDAGSTVYDFCGGVEDGEEEEVEEDTGEEDTGEEDFRPEPVRRAVMLGRNDPCWCGSGKKYKKCHLEADEKARHSAAGPDQAPPVGKNVEEAALRQRLIEFATDTLGKKGVGKAMLTFLGSDPPAGAGDDALARESIDWLIHDYVSPHLGRTVIEEFLRRSPGGLTGRQRKMLEAWSRSRYSLFEVREVRPGSGVEVQDLLAGGEFFVEDVKASQFAVPWDCFLARVEELEGRNQFTAIMLTVPRPAVPSLKAWARDAQRQSGLGWDAFLRANSHKLRQELSRLAERSADMPRVVSFEGDELVFSSARYKILDEEALRHALDQSKAFEREDTGEYGWLDEAEDPAGSRRSFGHVSIKGGQLKLECSTRQRLERGNRLLRNLAGRHLQHLGDDFTSWQAAIRDPKGPPAAPKGSGLPPEVERELVQKVIGEHYRKWLDTPLPALDGKTPRKAVTTPQGRARVVELLKLVENAEEHKRRDGLAWYDVSKLKAELGIEL